MPPQLDSIPPEGGASASHYPEFTPAKRLEATGDASVDLPDQYHLSREFEKAAPHARGTVLSQLFFLEGERTLVRLAEALGFKKIPNSDPALFAYPGAGLRLEINASDKYDEAGVFLDFKHPGINTASNRQWADEIYPRILSVFGTSYRFVTISHDDYSGTLLSAGLLPQISLVRGSKGPWKIAPGREMDQERWLIWESSSVLARLANPHNYFQSAIIHSPEDDRRLHLKREKGQWVFKKTENAIGPAPAVTERTAMLHLTTGDFSEADSTPNGRVHAPGAPFIEMENANLDVEEIASILKSHNWVREPDPASRRALFRQRFTGELALAAASPSPKFFELHLLAEDASFKAAEVFPYNPIPTAILESTVDYGALTRAVNLCHPEFGTLFNRWEGRALSRWMDLQELGEAPEWPLARNPLPVARLIDYLAVSSKEARRAYDWAVSLNVHSNPHAVIAWLLFSKAIGELPAGYDAVTHWGWSINPFLQQLGRSRFLSWSNVFPPPVIADATDAAAAKKTINWALVRELICTLNYDALIRFEVNEVLDEFESPENTDAAPENHLNFSERQWAKTFLENFAERGQEIEIRAMAAVLAKAKNRFLERRSSEESLNSLFPESIRNRPVPYETMSPYFRDEYRPDFPLWKTVPLTVLEIGFFLDLTEAEMRLAAELFANLEAHSSRLAVQYLFTVHRLKERGDLPSVARYEIGAAGGNWKRNPVSAETLQLLNEEFGKDPLIARVLRSVGARKPDPKFVRAHYQTVIEDTREMLGAALVEEIDGASRTGYDFEEKGAWTGIPDGSGVSVVTLKPKGIPSSIQQNHALRLHPATNDASKLRRFRPDRALRARQSRQQAQLALARRRSATRSLRTLNAVRMSFLSAPRMASRFMPHLIRR